MITIKVDVPGDKAIVPIKVFIKDENGKEVDRRVKDASFEETIFLGKGKYVLFVSGGNLDSGNTKMKINGNNPNGIPFQFKEIVSDFHYFESFIFEL